jgi:UDP-N-acetylglucosamine 2-epimerase (non-hydrolysing)
MKKKILCVVGTRPEAIKMAPVIFELRNSNWADVTVLATAQHREMLDQVLAFFSIVVDFDLNQMRPNQTLSSLNAQLLEKSAELFIKLNPDVVLVHGDTTTALACATAAFYTNVRIAHVEAGLRTGNLRSPFPEEFNRVSIARIADWHYCPTRASQKNLIAEGVQENNAQVTGNTVIDALLAVAKNTRNGKYNPCAQSLEILITCHRRENIGMPLLHICTAISKIASEFPQHRFIFPVHPNPNIRRIVYAELDELSNVVLTEPLNYVGFVEAMQRCHFVITDSGGIQEEAPALGKPVLVLRHETERPEALDMGVIRLVGTNPDSIYQASYQLLTDESIYKSMVAGYSPYGDGQASKRIAIHLRSVLGCEATNCRP